MSAPNSLKIIREFAEALDTDEFLENSSLAQRALLRRQADELRKVLNKQHLPITADTLVAVMAGATMQASMDAAANPLAKTIGVLSGRQEAEGANTALTLIVAYLSRDLLAGRRVE